MIKTDRVGLPRGVRHPKTIEDLLATPVVTPPGAGGNWQGVNHGELVRAVMNKMARYTRTDPKEFKLKLSLSRGNADLIAVIIDTRVAGKTVEGMKPALGVRVSNARKCGLTLYAGAVEDFTETPIVVACTTGRQHWAYTSAFDLDRVSGEAAWWWNSHGREYSRWRSRLQGKGVTSGEACDYLRKAVTGGMIPWRAAGRMLFHWDNSPPVTQTTAWNLLRCFYDNCGLIPWKQLPSVWGFTTFLFPELVTKKEVLL